MKIENVKQGSPEWLALRRTRFTASEAPAMLGVSKYMSRDDLLRLKFTGESEPVSPEKQALYDRGHAAEHAIRPFIESKIGAELYPITGTVDTEDGLPLLASFDGLSMDGAIAFEHKLWSEGLAEQVRQRTLLPHYTAQLDQLLLVSQAETLLFVVSDGTPDKMERMWYSPHDNYEYLLSGWRQFQRDLAEYNLTVQVAVPAPAPVQDLPAIRYQLDGLALTSNLDEYKVAAEDLVEKSKATLETDQDFADAEQRIKAFKTAEKNIAVVIEQVIGEIHDVAQFQRDLNQIGGLIRQARLNSERQVKARKELVRAKIVSEAEEKLREFLQEKDMLLGGAYLHYDADWWGAIKGKKTLTSMRSAVNDLLAASKIAVTEIADNIQTNLSYLDSKAGDRKSLFFDLPEIVKKPHDDFRAIVRARIAEHKEEEARREVAEKARREREANAALTHNDLEDQPGQQVNAPHASEPLHASETAPRDVAPRVPNVPAEASPDEIASQLIEQGIGKIVAKRVATLICERKIPAVVPAPRLAARAVS